MAWLMRSNRAAVSSMREPIGTRTCIRICPESTVGKKLLPRNGTSTAAMNPVTNQRRLVSASRSRPMYPARNRSKRLSNPR